MAALPENDRIAGPFIAAAGQTDFPADFPLVDAPGDPPGSCVVISRERSGRRSVLTLDDFAVTDSGPVGFTVRLTTPCIAGDLLWVVGRQQQKRLRAHTPNGAVRTATLEGDAMEAAARAQEAARDFERSLRLPLGETGVDLPTPSGRRNTILGFDASGAPTSVPILNVLDEIGLSFVDDGAWGQAGEPITHDDGAFF